MNVDAMGPVLTLFDIRHEWFIICMQTRNYRKMHFCRCMLVVHLGALWMDGWMDGCR